MTGTIVLSHDGWYIHLGPSSECIPKVTLPSTTLPFTPPLSFATRLMHALTTHLSLTPTAVRQLRLAVVQSVPGFSAAQRGSITHGAISILLMSGVVFYGAVECAAAATATPFPLLVHIAPAQTALATAHRVTAIPIGSAVVDGAIRTALAKRGVRLNDRQARHVRELTSVCVSPSTPVGSAVIHTDHLHITVGQERARTWDLLFTPNGKLRFPSPLPPYHVFTIFKIFIYIFRISRLFFFVILMNFEIYRVEKTGEYNIAEGILFFLKEIEDVYERARLAQAIIITGEGATAPGFAQRLMEEVNSLSHETGMVRREDRQLFKHVDSPFAANCLLWAGAAVLVETGATESDDSDRIDIR